MATASSRLKPRMQSGKAPAKGFTAGGGGDAPSRDILHIEIPVADTSPAALAQLAVDVASAFLNKSQGLGGSAAPVMLVRGADLTCSTLRGPRHS